jgi:phosphatidylserine/phosphatidylglycerophosphate/cardiolipin synthase-like enzyme
MSATSGLGELGGRPPRTLRAKLLVDAEHYQELVVRAISAAKVSVWIGTANLKTMLVEAPIGTRARARGRFVSFFESLAELVNRGVEVRILHAGAPSRPLAQRLDPGSPRARASRPENRIEMRRCPRVHLKMIAIDGALLYLGSANPTGAGLGAKGEGRRNFEMGIVTDSEAMLDAAQERFDRMGRGAECASCRLRRECSAPLDRLDRRSRPRKASTSPSDSKRACRNPAAPR